MKQITYFPFAEFITFTISLIVTSVLLAISEASQYFLILLIIPCYGMTMRDSYILQLDADRFKITPFNIFIGNSLIRTKSITKINSVQSIEVDDYNVYGAPYFITKRRYQIEYINDKGLISTSHFSISNKQKEKVILMELEKMILRP